VGPGLRASLFHRFTNTNVYAIVSVNTVKLSQNIRGYTDIFAVLGAGARWTQEFFISLAAPAGMQLRIFVYGGYKTYQILCRSYFRRFHGKFPLYGNLNFLLPEIFELV